MTHRILYVSPVGEIGGAELSLLDLVRCLDRDRFEPIIVSFQNGPLVKSLKRLGIAAEVIPTDPSFLRLSLRGRRCSPPLVALSSLRASGTILRLARFIRSHNISLVHTNGTKAHLLGGLAAILAARPIVWHLRDFIGKGFLERIFLNLARACPTKIIANSEAVARALGSSSGSKMSTVYNGVDIQRFHPSVDSTVVRRELGIEMGVPLVGMVGMLAPWKGQHLFLEAARRAAARFPSARFLLVGDEIYTTNGHGDYKAQLLRLTEAMGMRSRVIFTGYRADMHHVMAALDFLVHASVQPEPFGRVMIEAMAAGKPVIASRAGGVPEIVVHGETGFLVPPGDVTALAESIIQLLERSHLKKMMGESGRARAESCFTLERHIEAVSRIYSSLLETRS